ncbi:23S rRNA (guanosine2251-2'-O)-methyltransferase [Desulfobaculum xiamenense]|uniref:23S rRNA (Guanosine2251-2'-O)-methyltransferase n=1 Tax=Desulfobaculum xiamenense TaxID=995050 RepID=A0A846QS99_9BACT|nr:23S rRNA (guanosine(2251)-2'-O)-methyltransferase RlmB [Desulfobaculum xiamenense]NJB68054.1 23S rRNA (guanosine2251-2'-O)-methyltransferase [Desulfobaculum xiamenense]
MHNKENVRQSAEAADNLVPGRKPVLELVRNSPDNVDMVFVVEGAKNRDIGVILDACREARVRFRMVGRADMERMFPGNHQGVLARTSATGYTDLEELLQRAADAPLPLIVALDQVQDPGNVGAMARTLYALGGAGLVVPKDRTAYLGAAAVKSSAGALTRLPVARVVNLSRALDRCEELGWPIYGAIVDPAGQNMYTQALSTPAVLVMGNEEKGIRPNVAKRCSKRLTIPLGRDFDSLNVAQAAAIIMGEFVRQRMMGRG